jgi:hypothetical protein
MCGACACMLNYLCTSCTTRSGSCTGEEKARAEEDRVTMEMIRSIRERWAIFFLIKNKWGGNCERDGPDFVGYKGIKSREERRDCS